MDLDAANVPYTIRRMIAKMEKRSAPSARRWPIDSGVSGNCRKPMSSAWYNLLVIPQTCRRMEARPAAAPVPQPLCVIER